jgi:Lrp/AsnC family transcriptional regulator, leucine-responsive regulatory protein
LEFQGRIDGVDWRLLAELQRNARLSYAELGRRVGLTAPAVAERLRRMEDAGIIAGYRVDLRMEKIGLPIQAVIRIAGYASRSPIELGRVIERAPEVMECLRVTGEDAYIVRVAVRSSEHLEELLDRFGVHGRTITHMVLSELVSHRVVGPAETVPEGPAV